MVHVVESNIPRGEREQQRECASEAREVSTDLFILQDLAAATLKWLILCGVTGRGKLENETESGAGGGMGVGVAGGWGVGAQGFGGRGVGGGGECFFLPPPLEAKTLLHLQVMDSVQLVAGPGELKKRLSERCREGGDWGVGVRGTWGGGYCLLLPHLPRPRPCPHACKRQILCKVRTWQAGGVEGKTKQKD